MSGELPRDLAARPQRIADEPVRTPGVSLEPTTGRTASPSASGSVPVDEPSSVSPSVSEVPSPRAAPFRRVVAVRDPRGDASGLQAPPSYVDIARVRILSNGTNARLILEVHGPLPDPAADGEVIGVGIDLYRGADDVESAYQLFAEGGADGWFAWRQSPEGVESYQGTFSLGTDRLVFEVPWSALGDLRMGHVSAFVDWSERRDILNAAGGDRAPDRGRAAYPD